MSRTTARSALTGIRVLEVGEGVAGPLASSMLGDLGADVIKVERPAGDWARTSGRRLGQDSSSCFVAVNRNKRNIGLNLGRPSAQRVARRLVEQSDVLISNFRPGVMDRLGLGYDVCAALNPRLVYCSISAYGDTGRYRDLPGSDTVMQAVSGMMELIGAPDGPPLRIGFPIIDTVSALFATQGILAAVLARTGTGEGAKLDLSLLNTALALQALPLTDYLIDDTQPERLANQNPALSPAGAFRTRDGRYLTIVILRDHQWRALCEVLGYADLVQNPRFHDNTARVIHRTELNEILEPAFARQNRATWIDALQAADVPCSSVNTYADILADPDLATAAPIGPVAAPGGISARTVGHPLEIDGEFLERTAPPPAAGEHSREILAELSIPASEIHDMLEDGAAFTFERRDDLPDPRSWPY